jgi:Xaa-Pro aminopeptidase
MSDHRTPLSTFQARRRALLSALHTPAVLASGSPRPRAYAANQYRFRAKSHFLYFVGAHLPGAALLFTDGSVTLFVQPEQPGDALWTGPRPSLSDLARIHGFDDVRPVDQLADAIASAGAPAATLATEDGPSSDWLSGLLGRTIKPCTANNLEPGTADAALADAMISLRLTHDADAIAQLRLAAAATADAHIAAMRATRSSVHERQVYGALQGHLRSRGFEDSFLPIISTHGEILHNETYEHEIAPGDLLLCDAGAETPEGWAGDITRVWPVSGRFSDSQRALYDVVLDVQQAAIAACRKGTRYRHVHDLAKRRMVERLRDLGIFRGDVDGLVERGAAAIFFPHGIGHLLGLDAHDMEDLGDRAGYAPGRTRSTAFGDCYLRLDRDLQPGMVVTIEPGFYQVSAILADESITGRVGDDLRRDVLAKYADVRGIRIEDDVLVTDGDPEVLTSSAPKKPAEVEALVRG